MSERVKKFRENWLKIYFMLSLGMILFIYGVAVGKYEVFPYSVMRDAQQAGQDWLTNANYKQYAKIRPEKFIRAARHQGSGVTTYTPDKAYGGVTLVTSMWDAANGMQLIAMDGTVLHRWRVSLNEIFPKSTHPEREKQVGDWDTVIHGAHLYPNGDVVFNFEHEGLVKIDRCSKVLWKSSMPTHHSIYEDADGNLWVPGEKRLREPEKRLPLLDPPIDENYILEVSPDGKILEQISVLDVFYQSGQEALLFANGAFVANRKGLDILHLNDIEILENTIAAQFPLFQAGDILISVRHLNLIAVIDRSTKKFKWLMTGPFIKQHDPDFLANGRISVYDNRADDAGGQIRGGSRILSVDPVTRQVDTVYKGDAGNSFYTNISGKHQYLPNGNILIAEYDGGRIFEVTSSGEVVWSYINRYDEDEVYVVSGGTRYPANYGQFAEGGAQCP